jgi:spermidine/putrescine transport system permease protein
MQKNNHHYGFNKKKINFNKQQFYLIIPFLILTLLLVIIPLIFIFVKSFIPAPNQNVGDNFSFMFNDGYIFGKIFLSIGIALVATIFCVILALPFTYLLSQAKSKLFRSMVILVATAPI